MYSPSFEGFHAQLDCKLTYGEKKSNTANTRKVYKLPCSKTKQNLKGMMKNRANWHNC